MKFGKTFESHLTSEWRQQYMNYVELKTMIRIAVNNAPDIKTASIREISEYYKNFERHFFTTCQQELSRVADFYAQKIAEGRRRLQELKTQLNKDIHNPRQMGLACSEFYLSLIMLQNFQRLNYTAFRKICKKYDKYIETNVGERWFIENVSKAAFFDEQELRDMITQVEHLYTQYLTNGDRAKAMAKLRVPPLGEATPPGRVFLAGLMFGLFIVSAAMVVISLYYYRSNLELISAFGHLYRGPFVWVLCCFFMSINVYVWQRAGINHVLIFEVDLRNHVQPATFLEIASFFGYMCTISMLLFIHHNEFGIQDPSHFPMVCLVVPLVTLFLPLCIMNFPARMWIIRCLGRIVCAPFFNVTFADFWLADQMISLVLCVVDHYHLIRFFINFYTDHITSYDFEPDNVVAAIRCLPAWFRLAQCLRRCWDSKLKYSVYPLNAIKYATIIIVVFFSCVLMETSAKYNTMFDNPWIWGYLASSVISTVYCTIWDLVRDFALFQVWKCENIFLRENLIYPKWFYYFAIVSNILFRLVWILELYLVYYDYVLPYNCKTISCLCEITRRFIWNFLRLENEHLFNCGHFRAIRDIFLTPFNENEKESPMSSAVLAKKNHF